MFLVSEAKAFAICLLNNCHISWSSPLTKSIVIHQCAKRGPQFTYPN